jgi:hypothetical protein
MTLNDWQKIASAYLTAKEILRLRQENEQLRENSNYIALTEDAHKLLRALGICWYHARPVSCHQVINDEILPAIERLQSDNAHLRKRVEVLEKVRSIAAQTKEAGHHAESCNYLNNALSCDCAHETLRDVLKEAADG